MNCFKCGHQNPIENRYCGMCGGLLNRRGAPATELLPEDSESRFIGPDDSAAELRRKVRLGFERKATAEPVETVSRAGEQAPTQQSPQKSEPITQRPVISSDSTSMFHLNDGPAVQSQGRQAAGVTGPSFLGLNDDSGSGASADYLLEDEHRGGGKKWIVLFVLAALGGLGYAQYRANQRGTTLFAGLPAITAPRPPRPAPPLPPDQAQKNAGEPELTVDPTNEKLKSEQAAVKQAEASSQPAAQPAAASSAAKPETEQPDQKSAANTAATTQPQESKPAAGGASAPSKHAKPQTPQADQQEDDNADDTTPAAKSRSAVTRPAKAERGPDAGMLEQGQRYLYGQGVRKSCDQALNLIHGAANGGNAKARAQLGGMYATGNCVPFDRATAYRWFTMALQADPKNTLIERNRRMLWNEMSQQERSRVQAGLE